MIEYSIRYTTTGFELIFYRDKKVVLLERFAFLETAKFFGPRILRDRFSDNTRPGDDYYGKHH